MNAKVFSYKVEGIALEAADELLKVSAVFDRKLLTEKLKEVFSAENFTIDETSLSYKLIDDQLYVQGLAVEKQAPVAVGFQFGAK